MDLDVDDLMSALRSKPILSGTEVWDPLEKVILSPPSYRLIDIGFVLCLQNYRMLQPSRSRLMRRNCVTLQFTQSGAYRLYGSGQVRQVRSGSVRLNAMPASVSEFAGNMHMRGASIFIERELLIDSFGLRPDLWPAEYRATFATKAPSPVSIEMPLTPEMWLILDAMIDCTFNEPIRNVYLTAKAMELLSLTVMLFNGLARPNAVAGLSPAAREQRLIEAAALIYRSELGRPPSIEALSRRLGLNRNKLTDGFRSAFGTTPAEYSRQIRLEWAARRLSEGLDVGQAAAEVGYDSTAAFGRAFQQRYSRTPSSQAPAEPVVAAGYPSPGDEAASSHLAG
ncbi:helix-turn-helix transcriptional regulator [Bosea caraganae]|uniref:helix-turn-helix transcriptional regulator n=1 Tax=Bosea caraganae TaxID=2763117 RepID=UPI0015F0037D|nr:AraC family transcriptional regulator [Bosea caraganae]